MTSPIFCSAALRKTSHVQKRCTKSLASLLYVVQRGADEQSTAVLITRSARDFAQQRISNIRPAPPPPFGGAGLTSDHPRHVIGDYFLFFPMGTTKSKKGDGHIIFHVGKELPAEGSNLMLVPGVQKAQGRGVYFSDEPRLRYSGGEHFREELDVTPIFCIPMEGTWVRGKKHKKFGGEISYHSDQKILALFGLQSLDGEIDGKHVRYYYPSKFSLFEEPDVEKNGRHITSEFSDSILKGRVDFDEALRQLREEYDSSEQAVTEEQILTKMKEAMEQERLPQNERINEGLSELRMWREGSERMKINIR